MSNPGRDVLQERWNRNVINALELARQIPLDTEEPRAWDGWGSSVAGISTFFNSNRERLQRLGGDVAMGPDEIIAQTIAISAAWLNDGQFPAAMQLSPPATQSSPVQPTTLPPPTVAPAPAPVQSTASTRARVSPEVRQLPVITPAAHDAEPSRPLSITIPRLPNQPSYPVAHPKGQRAPHVDQHKPPVAGVAPPTSVRSDSAEVAEALRERSSKPVLTRQTLRKMTIGGSKEAREAKAAKEAKEAKAKAAKAAKAAKEAKEAKEAKARERETKQAKEEKVRETKAGETKAKQAKARQAKAKAEKQKAEKEEEEEEEEEEEVEVEVMEKGEKVKVEKVKVEKSEGTMKKTRGPRSKPVPPSYETFIGEDGLKHVGGAGGVDLGLYKVCSDFVGRIWVTDLSTFFEACESCWKRPGFECTGVMGRTCYDCQRTHQRCTNNNADTRQLLLSSQAGTAASSSRGGGSDLVISAVPSKRRATLSPETGRPTNLRRLMDEDVRQTLKDAQRVSSQHFVICGKLLAYSFMMDEGMQGGAGAMGVGARPRQRDTSVIMIDDDDDQDDDDEVVVMIGKDDEAQESGSEAGEAGEAGQGGDEDVVGE
ncbi:hypothetical protein Hypma_003981 [Hypsizygus marmoreus]|uniref:Uncharacterized protein n=1 Tax=Hypsizygus marmoreus TaxID=39966 RepID=A0A369J3H7_HYPMA|nr:hypothetical protein Hypma_003981 [Hypsizygus marmoreus]